MLSDLTFGPSFKVKRWFTGFGELSFQWIQICIGSPRRMCSYKWNNKSMSCNILFIISRRALAREGDYEIMPVCACVRALVSHADFSKTTTATDFL